MSTTRREFLSGAAGTATGFAAAGLLTAQDRIAKSAARKEKSAHIAITLDLEMSRNFPHWEDSHWDYEKGNLDQAAKDYTVSACRRVKRRGGVIHTFVVGQVFEQPSVDWLKTISREGHPIGNHTYDHVNLLAQTKEDIQYRFRRAPWLIRDRSVMEILRENIVLTNIALRRRVGVVANGFRTPGGFANALHGREDRQTMLLDLGFDWISCKYPAHAGIVNLAGTGQGPSRQAYDNIVAAQADAQPLLYPTGLLDIPMSPISDIGAFRNGRWRLSDFLQAIRLAMEWVIDQRAVFDFLAHPSCLGVVDPEFQAIDLICDLVESAGDRAEIVPLDVIAQRARTRLATSS